jgi:hypothetical protein
VDGELEVVTSQSIIEETTRILRDKFRAGEREIERALAVIDAAARVVETNLQLNVVKGRSE